MASSKQDPRSVRLPWSDRWLLEAFRDRPLVLPEEESFALSAWEALESAGVTPAEIVAVVQEMSGAKLIDVSTLDAEQRPLLTAALASRFDVVPVRLNGRTLEVATGNPLASHFERDLSFACGRRISVNVASPAAIRKARERVYGAQALPGMVSRISWVTPQNILTPIAAPTRGLAVDLLDRLIVDALDQRASDIHCEPSDGELLVRYRIDGVLHDVARVPADVTPLLLSCLKVGAGLDIANRLRPQDGRSSVIIDGRAIDLRISTLPLGERMEKAVIRILDASSNSLDFVSLGFNQADRDQLARILSAHEGMVLVTGPTGSGKTTTLYAALRQMQSRETNIVTVEDPIEYRLEGVNQVQVHERAGLTFASALRSILRQDPDVVLVGEVRDVETAAIAIRASMTGHMVLSTLHTNDASSAIGRLADMGVDMSALSGALKAVIAQRLVRRLCTECQAPQRMQDLPHELHWVFKDRDVSKLRAPVGCAACRGTGYRGRMVVAEIFVIDDETQQLMGRSTQRLEFLQLARKGGMHTLWETGLESVLQGLISFDELIANITPPIPDADLHQEDVDRLLADIMGAKPQPDGGGVAVSSKQPQTHANTQRPSAGVQPTRVVQRDAVELVRHRDHSSPVRLAISPWVPSADNPRVLIVNEDRQQRRELRKAFMRVGCTVIEAADGDTAFGYACRLRPDAVVTEIALPGLDGIGLLQMLLTDNVVQHVFVYTDQQDPQLLQWARDLGAREAVVSTEEDVDTLATLVRAEFFVADEAYVLRAS